MTKSEVMLELSKFGNEQTKKIFARHGAREPFYGVKVGDLKTLVKKIKTDHNLALELYETGNSDAMYLAGLIADEALVSLMPDKELDQEKLIVLLDRVARDIHQSHNRVRYTMNGFVIAVGSYVEALTKKANEVAATIGKVSVDMGGTSCKVPLAIDYIKKIEAKGTIGKKRKSARC